MKRLTLMRHAKSSWKDPEARDPDRPLNSRGRRDAPRMGKRLAKRGFCPDRILSSPAARAWVTAEAVAEKIGYPLEEIVADDRIYGGGPEEITGLLRELDDRLAHVMVFGHNPTFTQLAVQFTRAPIENVPTSGIVDIAFEMDSWREIGDGKGRILDFDYPKKKSS